MTPGSKVLITRVRRLPDPATPDPGTPDPGSPDPASLSNKPANKPANNPSASDPAANSQAVSQGAGSESKDSISIDLNDLLDSGDPKFNIPLYGGDVVTVPHSGVIYAVGAVQRPGGFRDGDGSPAIDRSQDRVAWQAGWRRRQSRASAVILRQPPGSAQRRQLPVDVKKIITLKSEDLELQRNDILYVPDSTGKHALRRSAEIAIAIATGAAIIRVAIKRPYLARKSSARMDEQTNLITKDHGAALDGLAPRTPYITLEMVPRESHLLDYLMILRKHQWLIVSFLLALVTIVTIATFRIQPVYEATTRIEIDRENTNFLPFGGNDPYDLVPGFGRLHRNPIQDFGQRDARDADGQVSEPGSGPEIRGTAPQAGNSARRGAKRWAQYRLPPPWERFWEDCRSNACPTAGCWTSRLRPRTRSWRRSSSMRM